MSVDPIIAMPENGQSLNPYSYVMNNPLKYTDPSGYSPLQTDSNSCDNACEKINEEFKEKANECEGSCVIKLLDSDGQTVKTYVVSNGNSSAPSGTKSNNGSSGGDSASSLS